MPVHLPVVEDRGTLRKDGSREFVHPADVRGRFTTLRYVVFGVLMAVYLALPFVHIGGRPALFLDIANRRFFLFGASFNAQDFWLAFFLLSGLAFALFLVTTLAGRVWCGYACPQTVFLEGLYRRVERWLEGPRQVRLRRNAGPTTFDRLWRKTTKHALFVLVSLLLSHFFLSYFVSLPSLARMVRSSPLEHPAAFGWMAAMSAILYFNFAWFREQLCLIVCPYGRLQSLLTDEDTLVIGYDTDRGEPRGKVSDPTAGDCVDCQRCVVVCPTGIDIRRGLQIECIGCAACVDACDDIMDKVGRPRGLIRYDSLRGLAGKTRRILRPGLALYAVLGLVGLAAALLALRSHSHFEANLLRGGGAPYTMDGDQVRNTLQLHLVNKRDRPVAFEIVPASNDALTYVVPMRTVHLGPLGDTHMPVIVTAPRTPSANRQPIEVEIRPESGEPRTTTATFVAPGP